MKSSSEIVNYVNLLKILVVLRNDLVYTFTVMYTGTRLAERI